MEFNYCPKCGNKLSNKEIEDEGLVPDCNHCDQLYFFTSKICALIAIINEEKEIVLTKQKHIVTDSWVLVSGYIRNGEEVENTVIREVSEETGLIVENYKYIKSYYIKSVDMLMLGFIVSVNKTRFKKSKEINEIEWYTYNTALQKILKDSVAEQLLKDISKEIDL